MGRIEFKKHENTKLVEKAKSLGADYFEDDCAIFIVPKKYGTFRLGIQLNLGDNHIRFGKIIEDCNNFEKWEESYNIYLEEQLWIIEILSRITKK